MLLKTSRKSAGVLSSVMNSASPSMWSMTVIADTVSNPRLCVKRTISDNS